MQSPDQRGLSHDDAIYAAALHQAWSDCGGGIAGFRKLVSLGVQHGWARVWRSPRKVVQREIDTKLRDDFDEKREHLCLKLLSSKLSDLGISVIPRGDAGYPAAWEHLADPPPLAYTRGRVKTVEPRAVAVVGTRAPDEYGSIVAQRLGAGLASRGAVVVSGLAQGIDSAAHEGVLDVHGRTIAVLGTGVDRIYPRHNRGLAQRILNRGTLLSELPIGAGPTRWSFPQRNRLIAALGRAVVVVQARHRSGTRYTVDAALELGRQVFAVPGPVNSVRSEGPHQLIREGAVLLETPDQLFDHFGWNRPAERSTNGVGRPEMSDEFETILALIGRQPVGFDRLARLSGFDVPELQTALLELELGGAVRQLPGLRFVRIC